MVYDEFANVRDRVQSIVLVPNSAGHVNVAKGELKYLVSPANMAKVISNNTKKITIELLVLDASGKYNALSVYKTSASSDGLLTVYFGTSALSQESAKSLALHVYDNVPGGTDYITSFTLIDWK